MRLSGPLAACVAVLAFAIPARCDEPPRKPLATITVQAGEFDRLDVPVSIELPRAMLDGVLRGKLNAVLRLVESTGDNRKPIATQLETVGDPPRVLLWFILPGKTPAGTTRSFDLVAGSQAAGETRVETKRTDAFTELALGAQPVLRYNHVAVQLPAGVDDAFRRSAYIHPLYTPSGKLMTEDFPADHFHHKGIWQAWVNTEFEGRHIDFWNLKARTGTVNFIEYGEAHAGEVFSGFQARHAHVDLTQKPEKTVLVETWNVRVYNVGGKDGGKFGGYFLFDLTSSQRCASDQPLLLKEYRYGGVGYRGPKDWGKKDYEVLTSEGKTYANAHGTRARWCIHSGKVAGEDVAIVLMSHSQNPAHPEPMRTSGGFGPFFNWAPVQAGDMTLEPGKEYVFRYRFLVADGKLDADAAEQAWRAFGDAPKVELKLAEP